MTAETDTGTPARHATLAGFRRLARALMRLGLMSLLLALWQVPAHANDLIVGQPAPPITLTTLDGQKIATRDLHGKVVIVTFWATWCAPCREELPLLSRYAQQHAKEGLVVLGFSLDTPDDLSKVRAVSRTLAFPVGLLGDPHVPGYGRIWHLPVSFTIDREGRLIDDGWKDRQPAWTQARLERVVTPQLGLARRPELPLVPHGNGCFEACICIWRPAGFGRFC